MIAASVAAFALWPVLMESGISIGINRNGRFAALSNYREPAAGTASLERSRGHLVRDVLLGNASFEAHATRLYQQGRDYRGFNLLLGDAGKLLYVSNRSTGVQVIANGIHGLSNHLLDTDWPKVSAGRAGIESVLERDTIDTESLFELLADPSPVGQAEPPHTIVPSDPEELRRRMFILSPIYGTRSSTVVLVSENGQVQLTERRFGPEGVVLGTSAHTFLTA